MASLQPAILEFERLCPLTPWQRTRTLLRIDGGFGSDENLNWLLPRGYQVVAKGYSGKRAAAYARRVAIWQEVRPNERWVALSPTQLALTMPTKTIVLRWITAGGQTRHALHITTLTDLTPHEIADLYDDRGAAEVDIQTDKMGLLIARRRKHLFTAQEMLILLNDWAHNLLAWFHTAALCGSRFEGWGPKRIVRDLFTIPAEAVIVDDALVELRLSAAHPYAEDMARCLTRLWQLPLPNSP